jgi:HAE1 family hydrophobic/amphiphilic exporter-1
MSLLGLSLVGILVDDAIVVLENIYRHMEMGKNKVRAAYDGTAEIGGTVVDYACNCGCIFTNCIEFWTGFYYYAILCHGNYIHFIIIVASFTIIPWLSSRYGKLEHIEGKTFWKNHSWFCYLTRFINWISGLLTWFGSL